MFLMTSKPVVWKRCMTNTVWNSTRQMQEFRDQTNNPKMAGVMSPSWRCKVCRKSKPLAGRKSLGYKQGFQCADCAKGK